MTKIISLLFQGLAYLLAAIGSYVLTPLVDFGFHHGTLRAAISTVIAVAALVGLGFFTYLVVIPWLIALTSRLVIMAMMAAVIGIALSAAWPRKVARK